MADSHVKYPDITLHEEDGPIRIRVVGIVEWVQSYKEID